MLEALDTPATAVADALARLEQAVSPLVGIVRAAPAIVVAADEARLYGFACQLASAAKTTGAETVDYAGSAHVDLDRARAASIGEAVERYSATFVPDGLTITSAGELGDRAVPPESFGLFHDRIIIRADHAARYLWPVADHRAHVLGTAGCNHDHADPVAARPARTLDPIPGGDSVGGVSG